MQPAAAALAEDTAGDVGFDLRTTFCTAITLFVTAGYDRI